MNRSKAAWVYTGLAAVVFWASAACLAMAHEVKYPETRGGYLHKFITTLDAVNAAGEEMRITSRICASSCTLYLGAANLCVSRRTKFKAHCYSEDGKCSAKWNSYAAGRIAEASPSVANLIASASTSKRLQTVTGAYLIDNHGIRECDA